MSDDYMIMFFEKWWWRLTFFFVGYSVCLAVVNLRDFFKRVKYHKNKAKAEAIIKEKKKKGVKK